MPYRNRAQLCRRSTFSVELPQDSKASIADTGCRSTEAHEVPGNAHVLRVELPTFVSVRPLPQFHLYARMPTSSVEPRAASWSREVLGDSHPCRPERYAEH